MSFSSTAMEAILFFKKKPRRVVKSIVEAFSLRVLRDATNDFSRENILGTGASAKVYKGSLHGNLVAVKKLASLASGASEFESEISVLTKVRHRHLLSLLGYCLEEGEKILIYEYMPKGTLNAHLFNPKESPLDWNRRLRIALDIAKGLEYMHDMAPQTIIHRDLNPSNILLGDNMRAKIGDFGLARLSKGEDDCSINVTKVAGTFGYMAPEFIETGRITTKADVYSFGVILMQLITCRRATDANKRRSRVHIVQWFTEIMSNDFVFQESIDPLIKCDRNEDVLTSIHAVAKLAVDCCRREPQNRPHTRYVANVLFSLVDPWKSV